MNGMCGPPAASMLFIPASWMRSAAHTIVLPLSMSVSLPVHILLLEPMLCTSEKNRDQGNACQMKTNFPAEVLKHVHFGRQELMQVSRSFFS